MSSGPLARMPDAPPASAACAMAAMIAGARNGLPGGAWQDTTSPPHMRRSASSEEQVEGGFVLTIPHPNDGCTINRASLCVGHNNNRGLGRIRVSGGESCLDVAVPRNVRYTRFPMHSGQRRLAGHVAADSDNTGILYPR